jgi:hypothetical protein
LREAINIAREEIGKKIKTDVLTGNLSRDEVINRATLIVLHKAGIISDMYPYDFVFYVLALRGFDKHVRISSCARPSCGFMISALHHEKTKRWLSAYAAKRPCCIQYTTIKIETFDLDCQYQHGRLLLRL